MKNVGKIIWISNLSDVIKIADTMLYKAKYSGKNRVVSSYIE